MKTINKGQTYQIDGSTTIVTTQVKSPKNRYTCACTGAPYTLQPRP